MYVCLFVSVRLQVRPTKDELTGGHASRHSHGSRAGRHPWTAPMAVRRLLKGCRAGQQNGIERNGWVNNMQNTYTHINTKGRGKWGSSGNFN